MKRRSTPVTMLSFLDLLCCGLGAVMLLFMIVIAIKDRIEFGPPPETTTPSRQEDSPFVVVLVADQQTPLFEDFIGSELGPFEVIGTGLDPRRIGPSWSDRHAMFIAPTPPEGLRITRLAQGVDARVQIFHQGQRMVATNLSEGFTPDPNGSLTLWPLPYQRGDQGSKSSPAESQR